MKKIYSLLKACMSNDMNIFKVKQKNNNKKSKSLLPFFLSFLFMFAIWSNVNMIFEKIAPMHLQTIVIPIVVFITSIMTIIEGIYKAGPLLFNCKDDQLLFSLPIKRKTILFIRMFKFYIFELIFNSLFIIPLIIAYIRWAENIEWTFFPTSFIMIIMLPIIPITLSCIIGVIVTNFSSKFKFKNLAQIMFSIIILSTCLIFSFNTDKIFNYIANNSNSINDFIIKLYYPAGIYAKLISNFNILDLIIFILINIIIFIITLFILSKFYFKINLRLKSVSSSNKIKISKLIIKSKPPILSLIKKELNIFFKTPVFIVNAGFGLVIYIIAAISLSVKYDSVISLFSDFIPNKILQNYISIFILILISSAAFMTSITNSVISLEGKNINILKSLPINTKTILMSKIYAALSITTVPILIGDIILFIRFRLNIFEIILLLIFSIITPLISHFIGLIINLKYPKLEYENSAEVVKQSISSFLSVIIGMLLLILSVVTISKLIEYLNSLNILLIFLAIYTLMDIILYLYLTKKSIKKFSKLTI